ncbi:MAG: transcriptional repressor NrdR [Elusimicrobia bacterium]|nr:transcriptional repressor NrdR [Elusimicrobiota bacterium]
MRCPYCSASDSKVIDSRAGEESKVIRRRRECLVCRKRFSTYERLEPLPLMVIKTNGTREPFDPAKVRAGLMKACEKRPISIDTIEKIVAEVEYAISNYVMEVPSKIIGEMILDKLEKLDTVSYLRFASVFKGFNSIGDFIELATLLKSRTGDKMVTGEESDKTIRRGRQQAAGPGAFGTASKIAENARLALQAGRQQASLAEGAGQNDQGSGGDNGTNSGKREENAEPQNRDKGQ